MFRFLLVSCFLLAGVLFAAAQKESALLKILDVTGQPLASVTVVLNPDYRQEVTSVQGFLQFDDLYEGTYQVTCTHVNYDTYTLPLVVRKGKRDTVYVHLNRKEGVLDNVAVQGADRSLAPVPDNLIRAERSAMPVTVITRRMIELMGSRRLDELLKEQTGIAIVNNTGGGSRSVGVQLQGFGSDYVVVLIDGQPMVGRNSGNFDLSRISVANIERIEIIKGASSCLFGSDALGGAINIITRHGAIRPQALAALNYGSLNITDATLEGEAPFYHQRGSVSFSANYYHTDGFNTNPYLQSGTTAPPHDNYSAQGSARYRLTKKSIAGTSLRYSLRRSLMSKDWGEGMLTEDHQNENDFNLSAYFDHNFRSGLRSMSRYYFTRYSTDENIRWSSPGTVAARNRFDQNLHRFEQQFAWQLKEQLNLTGGLGGTTEIIANSDWLMENNQQTFFAYLQGDWFLNPAFQVTGGIRYDHTSYYGGKPNPSLGVQYKIAPGLSLKAGFGTGFKAPDFRMRYQVFFNPAANYLVIGNDVLRSTLQTMQDNGEISEIRNYMVHIIDKALQPERSNSFNTGVLWQPVMQLKIEAGLFYHRLYNQIDAVQVATGTEIRQVFSYRNLPEAVNKGTELTVKYAPLTDLELTIGYQYLVAKDLSVEDSIRNGNWPYNRNIHDPATGASFAPRPSDYWGIENRSRHMLNVRLFYAYRPLGINANVRFNYRSRYPFADYNGNHFIDRFDIFVPDHGLLNVSLEKRLLNDRLSIRVSAENIFDFTSMYMPGQPGRVFLAGITYRFF